MCAPAYFRMASVDHDAVAGNPLLREGQGKLEVLGIGGMVKVDGNGDRGLVGTWARAVRRVCSTCT